MSEKARDFYNQHIDDEGLYDERGTNWIRMMEAYKNHCLQQLKYGVEIGKSVSGANSKMETAPKEQNEYWRGQEAAYKNVINMISLNLQNE